jgi:hypothetical protein
MIRSSQRKEKGGSTTYFGFCPDAPAVPVDDTLHRCQANACALEILSAVHPLENTK